MTREQFKEMTGEDPEDMFGPDWEAILEDWGESESHEAFGGCVATGPCYGCKDGF